MMSAMKFIKDLLDAECTYRLPDDVMWRFIGLMTREEVRKGETIIDEGCVNPDIYILAEGIFSYNYLNGTDERCHAFALPGTMMWSAYSYYAREPAVYTYQACCDSVVYHCRVRDFDDLIKTNHEFAQWVLCYAQCQLYHFEKKNSLINGDATERFKSMLRNRPEIFEKVSKKAIASYLGITQQYLSVLLKKMC